MSIDFPTLFLRHDGRLGRQPFWIGIVILMIASAFAGMIPVVGQVAGLVALWPAFCLLSQRLHDTGRSGRMAVFALIPAALGSIVGILAGIALITPGLGLVLLPLLGLVGTIVGLAALASLAFIVWVGVTPGETGANAWGQSPASPIELGRSA